jgi:nucleoside-diphosphate-sugar epimerase
MKPPIIAVTGASGFIGEKFIHDAMREGYSIRALTRTAFDQHNDRIECVPFDLNSKVDIDPMCLAGCSAVVHLAAYIPVNQNDPEEAEVCFEANALGTLRLLKAVEEAGVPRFIQTVSANSYDSRLEIADETSPMFPAERAPYYLVSKMAQEIFAEHWALSSGRTALSFRLGSIYGVGQTKGIIPTMAKNLLDGNKITLVNDGCFGADFATVSDVSAALLSSIGSNASGSINIGSGRRTTIRRIVELLLEHSERDWSAVENVTVEKSDKGFPALDISKAKLFGYQATSIEIGVKALVDWLRG